MSEGGPKSPFPPRATPKAAGPRRIAFFVVGLLVMLVGTVTMVLILRPATFVPVPIVKTPGSGPTEILAPPVSPDVESRIFQVAEASGRVEAKRGGHWVLVSAGDVLTQDDLVRTGNGRAILKLHPATEIELRDRVEIRLDSISRAGTSVDLHRGRVVANVLGPGRNLTITSAHTRTANQTGTSARFVVTADERGRVSVATTEGSARFESGGRAVDVRAGTATQAEPGRPPDDPETIPEEVFLAVVWPADERHADSVPVSGRAGPGTVVRVNGVEAEVDRGGRFVVKVSLRNGQNPIEVAAEDSAGRSKIEKREILKFPTEAPELVPVPTELWKKQPADPPSLPAGPPRGQAPPGMIGDGEGILGEHLRSKDCPTGRGVPKAESLRVDFQRPLLNPPAKGAHLVWPASPELPRLQGV